MVYWGLKWVLSLETEMGHIKHKAYQSPVAGVVYGFYVVL